MSSVNFRMRSDSCPSFLSLTLSYFMWDRLSDVLRQKKTLVILHGTSAAGKSSLSGKLAEKLDCQKYDHDNFTSDLREEQTLEAISSIIRSQNQACIMDTNTLSSNLFTTAEGFPSHLMLLVYCPLRLVVKRFFERKSENMNALGYILKGFYSLYLPAIVGGTTIGEINRHDIEWIESQIPDGSYYLKQQWNALKTHFGFDLGVQEVFIQPKNTYFGVIQTEQDIKSSLEDVRYVLQKFIEF